jgi:hypothetical protein
LCGLLETERWIEQRQRHALDCSYFHIIFTVHHALHPLWQFNRRLFTNLLFHAGWHSLRELLASPRWLGAQVGVIGAFQSWGETLQDHVHLHFLVTAGGVTPDGRWLSAPRTFLLPTRVLRDKFRGKFLAYLREGLAGCSARGHRKADREILAPPTGRSVQQCLNLLNKLGRMKWNVRIEPPYDYPDGAIKYLARYMHRGSVSEKRICSYDGHIVVIRYKRPEEHPTPTFRLSALEFITRFLRHVPQKRTHCVRTYGLFHPSQRERLDLARAQLGQEPVVVSKEPDDAPTILARLFPDWDVMRCPVCGRLLVTTAISPRWAHAPPEVLAA